MKTVIEMAEEAGFERLFKDASDWVCFTDEIERFAERVRADEREACAKVCDTTWNGDADTYDYTEACNECAEAIRNRSNT